MNEECLICNAPPEYLTQGEMMEYAICHKKEPDGHALIPSHDLP